MACVLKQHQPHAQSAASQRGTLLYAGLLQTKHTARFYAHAWQLCQSIPSSSAHFHPATHSCVVDQVSHRPGQNWTAVHPTLIVGVSQGCSSPTTPQSKATTIQVAMVQCNKFQACTPVTSPQHAYVSGMRQWLRPCSTASRHIFFWQALHCSSQPQWLIDHPESTTTLCGLIEPANHLTGKGPTGAAAPGAARHAATAAANWQHHPQTTHCPNPELPASVPWQTSALPR